MKQIGFESIKKRKKSIYPNQYICEEKANGVMCNGNFYPFKYIGAYTWTWIIEPKRKIRYYIKSVQCAYYSVGICGETGIKLEGTQNNILGYFFAVYLPPITIAGQQLFSAFYAQNGFLLDENTGVDHVVDTTWGTTIICYAEIDVLPGEFNPKVVEE